MGTRPKVLLNRRCWLRPLNSWGPDTSLRSKVTQYEYYSKSRSTIERSLDGTLGLRDCSNFISFDFEASTSKHAAKQLAMLDKLVSELQKVRDAMELAISNLEVTGWTSHVDNKKKG